MFKPALFKQLIIVVTLLTLLTFAIGSWFGSQATLVQVIRPTSAAEADLFGEETEGPPGTLIGSPKYLIIRSEEAFIKSVETKDQAGQIIRYVSEPKLNELGEYPLQRKTVLFFRNIILVIGLLIIFLLGFLWYLSDKRQKDIYVSSVKPE